MFVQFLKPEALADGSIPANLKARIALLSADPGLANVAIGGIALWEGDGSRKDKPKGVLAVQFPRYGVIGGRPIKATVEGEDGTVTTEYRPSSAGRAQIERIAAAVLTCWTDAMRAGSDPFIGRFELALPRVDAPAEVAGIAPAEPTEAELEALTAPAENA